MKKEILLYSSAIYSYVAEDFIIQMEAAKTADVTLRINTNGGDPDSTWGMIAKWKEHKGNKNVKVDGKAHSMGLFFLCFSSDNKECLDVSTFILHRAAYSEWVENDPNMMTQDRWDSLKRVNDVLRAAFEATIDVKKFEKLKGVTLDAVFNTPGRIDVEINAQEALEIGLVNKVVAITPEKKAEIEGSFRIAAQKMPEVLLQMPELKIAAEANPTTTKTNKMDKITLAELKAQHPEVYAEAVKDGVTAERERVTGYMAFTAVDAEGVAKAIKEGTALTMATMAEFSAKALAGQKLGAIAADSTKGIQTAEEVATAATAETKNLEEFNKEVQANLKKFKG